MSNSKIEISGSYIIKMLLIVGGILAFLYVGASLLLPLFVALIVATLLDIPTKKFQKWGIPNWLSITLSILAMLVVFSLLTWLITSQLGLMAEDWPEIKEKAVEKLNLLSQWANDRLGINYKDYVGNNQKLIKRVESFAKVFLSSITNMLSQSLIIFVYIILFLMQKKQFISFFKKVVKDNKAMGSLLTNSAEIISSYFVGKGKIMLFLFGIYYLGFTLGNVPYALFLALFAALFSIIPYVGNIIGGGIAIIMSYLYSGTTPALIVIGVIAVAQLVENYVLTPWIIGDEINLNPFITVFGVILFSVLWGMVGAVISLPLLGILKVILDHTKGLEAFAFIMKKE